MRADHTLDLSVAMATPLIRPHPARWLLERLERTNRAILRDDRDIRNETKRYNTTRQGTRRDEIVRDEKGKGSE